MTLLQLNPAVVTWREVDGEILALDVPGATYLSTNTTGAVLWRALVHGASHRELVATLVSEFEVDAAQAAADVDAFVSELAAHGLLET